MNDPYGTTDATTREPMSSSSANLTLDQIDEDDIRTLPLYDWDNNDGETLVGIGPFPSRSARKSAPGAAPAPRKSSAAAAPEPRKKSAPTAAAEPPVSVQPSSLQPMSEPPGPWGSDHEVSAPRVRSKKLGIWGVAVPALLVAAAGALAFLRVLGGVTQRHPERATATSVAPVVRATAGLAIPLTGLDVHVYLDGQDRGRPPLVLTELTPGSHALSVRGSGFAPFEQPVLLVSDHVSMVEPKLTLVHGAIVLVAGSGAQGATVEVVGANERRVIASLPARLDAAPGEYVVHAKKAGYLPFETGVQLSASSPEADVTINLEKPAPLSGGAKKSDGPEGTAATPVQTGTLNITSSPPSNIVLDGRPLGKAPRAVVMPAGSHRIVFVHPQFGRQSLTVSVAPDQTTNASVDF
jgi:hypothetical protein